MADDLPPEPVVEDIVVPEEDDGEVEDTPPPVSTIDKLARKVFMTHPAYKRWVIKEHEWHLLDSLEIKEECERMALEYAKVLRNPNDAVFAVGDAITGDALMTSRVWEAMFNAIILGKK